MFRLPIKRFFSSAPKSLKKGLGALATGDLKGKTVLVRVDFNVPMKKDTISNDIRIRESLPTIQYLRGKGSKVILCSHLGRPDGAVVPKLSLQPVSKRLSELLQAPVTQAADCVGNDVKTIAGNLKDGDVLLLENVRFHKQEEDNDPTFSSQLVQDTGAQVYVNDAFGTAHRAHSSTEGVARLIKGPAVAGFLMEKELQYLIGAISSPARPFAAIVGGAKVSTKIQVLESLMSKVDVLLLGGAMIFTFMKARGLPVGKSRVEDAFLDTARRIEALAKERNVDLVLPIDFVSAASAESSDVVTAGYIPDNMAAYDIGPASVALFQEKLNPCGTVLFNGPLGMFEVPRFANGTVQIARALAGLSDKGKVTIVGGGDTVSAIENLAPEAAKRITHISTGGGACLELLEGKVLPGVAALNDA